jgi:nicotinamidase-related amidase
VEPELPEPRHVTLKASDTAVIVVDMQNDFCHKNGRLFVPTAPPDNTSNQKFVE